jgi:hypothetical protein
MNARAKGILAFVSVVAIVAALSILAGCKPASESIRDVIDNFIAGVNDGDMAAVRKTLDANATGYNGALIASYWETFFPDTPYAIGTYSDTGNSATVTFTSASGGDKTYYFEMADGGDTFYIKRIRFTNSSGSSFFQ